MAFMQQLTSRKAVEDAISEFDQLGRERFLQRYGFRPARDYYVFANQREYDSKAIAGVAYEHQFPGRGPLKPSEFSGGMTRGAAAYRLRELRFPIKKISDGQIFE